MLILLSVLKYDVNIITVIIVTVHRLLNVLQQTVFHFTPSGLIALSGNYEIFSSILLKLVIRSSFSILGLHSLYTLIRLLYNSLRSWNLWKQIVSYINSI